MAFKMKYKNLKDVVSQLNSASKKHKKQAEVINNHIKEMGSPMKLKDACYYKAKRAHKVFPSAYASGMIAKCRKNKGKK
jgi:hypothetical protein